MEAHVPLAGIGAHHAWQPQQRAFMPSAACCTSTPPCPPCPPSHRLCALPDDHAIALVLGLVYLGQGTLHEGDVSVSSVQNIMGERQGGRCTWQMGQRLGNTSSTGSC